MNSSLKFKDFQDALVRSCYRALLGREPEHAVLASQGPSAIESDQEAAIQEVLVQFQLSDEYKHRLCNSGLPVWDGSLHPVHRLIDGARVEVEDRIRQRCTVSYLGNETALCRVLGRYHMFVETTDVGFATHVMQNGYWEMPLTEFMVRTVTSGMRVVDVGGNFGYYSLLMADLVQHTGACHVFEPNVAVSKLLKQSLSVNGFDRRSRVYEIALGDVARPSMQFYIPTTEPKNARLVEGIDEGLTADGRFVEVPVRSIDEMANELGQIDFIKIDAEGAELAILDGMRETIRSQRPSLMIEINCGRGYDPRRALTELKSVYGEVRALRDDGYAEPVEIETILSQNVGEDWLIYFQR